MIDGGQDLPARVGGRLDGRQHLARHVACRRLLLRDAPGPSHLPVRLLLHDHRRFHLHPLLHVPAGRTQPTLDPARTANCNILTSHIKHELTRDRLRSFVCSISFVYFVRLSRSLRPGRNVLLPHFSRRVLCRWLYSSGRSKLLEPISQ